MHKVFGRSWWLSIRGKIDERIDGELSLIGLSFHSFHIRNGEVAIDFAILAFAIAAGANAVHPHTMFSFFMGEGAGHRVDGGLGGVILAHILAANHAIDR